MEEVSGGRMHYMFNRVGGLKEELPAGWTGRARTAVHEVRRRLPDIENLILGNEIFRARTRGVGVLSTRARPGVRRQRPDRARLRRGLDLRRDEPYLAYGELDVPVVTRTEGDCLARFQVLHEQAQRVARPRRRLPRPAGRAAARAGDHPAAQGAQGARGVDLRVDREPARPQRLLPGVPRREDAVAAQAAVGVVQQRPGARPSCCPGRLVADMVAILGSMFFVVGDIDK